MSMSKVVHILSDPKGAGDLPPPQTAVQLGQTVSISIIVWLYQNTDLSEVSTGIQ